MFMGEFEHTIDVKGRVIIPARFREELGGNFVITRGLDHCLFVYTMEEWKVIEEKLKTLPFTKKEARTFVRFFFSGASECELDKQGRVLLMPTLRDYAKLSKDAVIIGVSTRLEIWDKQEWNNYCNNAEASYEILAEEMVELGI